MGTLKSRVSLSGETEEGKNGRVCSVLCLSKGARVGLLGTEGFQLIDSISTRGPGPPKETEIHISQARLFLSGERQSAPLGPIYILPKWKIFSRLTWQVPNGRGCLMV